MTILPRRICPFCSLLCPIPQNGSSASLLDCHKRQRSLEVSRRQPDALVRDDFPTSFSHLLKRAQRPLIWIDGADVVTLRAAVRLAEAWPATIHIASSLGAQICNQVALAEGWFGTTLPELFHHSRLILAIGSSWMLELPMLRQQLEQQLPEDFSVWLIDSGTAFPGLPESWRSISSPRRGLFGLITELCLSNSAVENGAVHDLWEAIRNSPNTTILWDNSFWTSEQDHLVVHQIMTLAKQLNRRSRCNLLAIDSDTGSQTANAALLWLTGCHQTAVYDGQWASPANFRLDDPKALRHHFDAVIQICDTPSSRLTQDLSADLTLACANASHGYQGELYTVAAAGLQRDAILFRGDHGLTCFVSASECTSSAPLPTAGELLDLARAKLTKQGTAR